MSIDFFTPIDYLNQNNDYTSFLQEAADNYFSYGSRHRAFVLGSTGASSYQVQLVACKASLWTTALKIASLATIVLPAAALLMKIAARSGRQFVLLDPPESAEPPEILTLEKRESSLNRALLEERYREMFVKSGLDYSRATPLQKHVAFFAEESGVLTRESMQKGFERLRFGKIKSFVLAWLIFQGLSSSTGGQNGAIRLQDIAKGNHRSDTGVFTSTGEFDEAAFESLRRFAKTSPGLLTKSELAQMRLAHQERDQNISGAKTGALASKGEFDLSLRLFCDRYVIDAYGNASPAMSFERLRALYIDGPLLFEELAEQSG